MAGSDARMKAAIPWLRTVYGADVSEQGTILVRAVRTGRGAQCVRVEPDDAAFRAAVERNRAAVAACLSERESFTRWLTAPFASRSKAMRVLPALLDTQLPFRLEDCAVRFFPAGPTAEGTFRALAAGARLAAVERRLEACRQAGVDPIVLDQEGLALWSHSQYEQPSEPEAIRIVARLAGGGATLAIGTRAEFRSCHSVRASAEAIDRILRAQFRPSQETLEWAWCGSEAPEAGPALYAELEGSWAGTAVTHKDPATFLARAVATRALLAGPVRCNLRSGRLEHPRILARYRRHLTEAAVVLMAAGALLAGAALASRHLALSKIETARRTFSRQVDRLAGYHVTSRGDQAIRELEKAMKDQSRGRRPFLDAFSPSISANLAAILRVGRENDLSYETLMLRPESVLIAGTCAAWNQCEKLSTRLKQMGYSVRLDRRETSGDGRIHFSIMPGGTGG